MIERKIPSVVPGDQRLLWLRNLGNGNVMLRVGTEQYPRPGCAIVVCPHCLMKDLAEVQISHAETQRRGDDQERPSEQSVKGV